MNRLKVGVIIDSYQLPAWAVHVLDNIRDTQHFYITLVIKGISPAGHSLPLLFSYYLKRDALKSLHGPDAFATRDTTDLLANIPCVSINDTTAISQYKPDVILNLCSANVPEQLIKIPVYGVWQYFHSKYKKAAIPGSLEVLLLEPVTTSGVDMMLKDGTQRTIYTSHALTDPSSVKKSRNRSYWKSVSFASRLLEQLYLHPEHFTELHKTADTVTDIPAKHNSTPSDFMVAASFIKRAINKLKRPSGTPDWVLMYKPLDVAGGPFLQEGYKTILPPAGHFWADPCLTFYEGKYFVFIEDYEYAKGKGHIAVMELDENGRNTSAVPVLEKPYHLSYPFIFQHEDRWYMIPESSENKTIELYECDSFPYKWTFKKNLAENIVAVDTTVLFHNNKWWVFTNIEEHEGAMSLSELFIFYTDDLLNTPLTAHPKNPVVSDVRSARPAGRIFPANGKLLRPSQISAPYYGWGTSINEITELTETHYSERAIATMTPAGKIAGVHTISIANELAVIDALLYL